jgi:predicted 2-oxoglutarate/Fe(II)-dependent dioxygenase YbiX
MKQRLESVGDGIWTVADAFSDEECRALIERAEAIGFAEASVRTSAGPKMMPAVRNNDRVNLIDATLATQLWSRIADLAPPLDGQHACGVDDQLRFYRYEPGQQFRRHKDGVATDELGRRSKLSYLVYLNGDCTGGATVFSEDRDHPITVEPTAGTALLFRHALWHEGTPVTAGRKYVLRTDVFYQEA